MRRRELLKTLAVIPFGTAIGGCAEKDKERGNPSGILEVHLDGSFALVVQEKKTNSILAFSPRPRAGDEQHLFYLNGSRKPEDQQKSFRFNLLPEGLRREVKPDIDAGLNDFSFRTEHWRVGDSLVTIELPPPNKITFIGHRSPVIFQADRRKAWMPTNHVLQYEIHGASAHPKLECSDASVRCEPSPDSYPGVTRYFFEVGPARSLDYAQSHAHAIQFFNYILQQSFPDLAKKYLLLPEYGTGGKQARIGPTVIPAVFRPDSPPAQLRRASYIVDCEFAGPLVTTSAAPTG